MAEKIIVSQNNQFETEILASNPYDEESDKVYAVKHIDEINPFGMLLVNLGLCTAELLNTYAHYHNVSLQEVEMILQYERIERRDCRSCDDITDFREQITEDINLKGDIKSVEKEKLLLISRSCPIHKIIKGGISIVSNMKILPKKETSLRTQSKV
jgi:putative redox protein